MDVSIVSTGVEVVHKTFKWYEKWRLDKAKIVNFRYGDHIVLIRDGASAELIPPGSVTIEGSHTHTKEIYWLITYKANRFWPLFRLDLKPNGTWSDTIGIGQHNEPREQNIGLFWVSDFMDAMLHEIKIRSDQLRVWDSITMKAPGNHMKFAQGVLLRIGKPS